MIKYNQIMIKPTLSSALKTVIIGLAGFLYNRYLVFETPVFYVMLFIYIKNGRAA